MAKAKKKIETHPNKAEVFYIEEHAGQKTAEELATDLGLAQDLVQEVLDKLPESQKKPKPKKKKLANFETGKGIVAMTGDQAMDDDAAEGTSPFITKPGKPKRNDAFFKEHEKNLHKIRPNEPFN